MLLLLGQLRSRLAHAKPFGGVPRLGQRRREHDLRFLQSAELLEHATTPETVIGARPQGHEAIGSGEGLLGCSVRGCQIDDHRQGERLVLDPGALHLGDCAKIPDGLGVVGPSVVGQGPVEQCRGEPGALPKKRIGFPNQLGVGVEAMEQDEIAEADLEVTRIDRQVCCELPLRLLQLACGDHPVGTVQVRVGSETPDLSLKPSLVTHYLERRAVAGSLGGLRRRRSAAGHRNGQREDAADRGRP